MFQYEYEKRSPSTVSCESRTTISTDWSRPSGSRAPPRITRPLPPRPICQPLPSKTTVPLRVWVIASASCLAVCAALVLATVVLARWGSDFTTQVYERPESYFSEDLKSVFNVAKTKEDPENVENDLDYSLIEKHPIFKNVARVRDVNKKDDSLVLRPQLHPVHDTSLHHTESKIKKKDKALLPERFDATLPSKVNDVVDNLAEANDYTTVKVPDKKPKENKVLNNEVMKPDVPLIQRLGANLDEVSKTENAYKVPEFKPTLPDVFLNGLPILNTKEDFDDYYIDENFYDDYLQSNIMTNYLIEKVQELHEWVSNDKDFEAVRNATKINTGTDFGVLLKALNESLVKGNVSIVMSKLRDMYFGENYTRAEGKKVILGNSTDLLSFGILTLDVMLLHNIQMMAWENQEAARSRMLRDPDVFAFNALFLEPNKVEARLRHPENAYGKRQNIRDSSEFDFGRHLMDNVLEVGMSTARAAIHLGRAYRNTKTTLNQLSGREAPSHPRRISTNHAMNRLEASFNDSQPATNIAQDFNNAGPSATSMGQPVNNAGPSITNAGPSAANTAQPVNNAGTFYTELDCVWLLYCKNLAATAKLNAPYGTMARINGVALRLLSGELSADRALDTMLYEALTGWTELKCADMFPRCSKANAASVVMKTILQPMSKKQPKSR